MINVINFLPIIIHCNSNNNIFFIILLKIENFLRCNPKGRLVQLMEGIHTVLRSIGTTHCAHVYLLGTIERFIQILFALKRLLQLDLNL